MNNKKQIDYPIPTLFLCIILIVLSIHHLITGKSSHFYPTIYLYGIHARILALIMLAFCVTVIISILIDRNSKMKK